MVNGYVVSFYPNLLTEGVIISNNQKIFKLILENVEYILSMSLELQKIFCFRGIV